MYDIWLFAWIGLFKNVNDSRAHTTDWLILVKKLPWTEQNRILFGLKFTKHELLPRQHNVTIKYSNYKRNTYITNKENELYINIYNCDCCLSPDPVKPRTITGLYNNFFSNLSLWASNFLDWLVRIKTSLVQKFWPKYPKNERVCYLVETRRRLFMKFLKMF
jgi:hypothetical protein